MQVLRNTIPSVSLLTSIPPTFIVLSSFYDLLFLSIIIIAFPDSESTSTYLAIQSYEFTHSLGYYSTVFDEESGRSIYLQAH